MQCVLLVLLLVVVLVLDLEEHDDVSYVLRTHGTTRLQTPKPRDPPRRPDPARARRRRLPAGQAARAARREVSTRARKTSEGLDQDGAMGALMSANVAGDEYSGKTVWVVGASSGIGEALAEAYYRRGAKVIVSARREQALEALVERLKNSAAAPGADAKAVVVDSADLDRAQANAKAAIAAFGGAIDILVLSAGISNRGAVADTDISVEQRLFQVNFFGTIALTKAILPHFFENGSGQIVVVSSVQGLMGLPQRAPYAASKHAIHGYFESLRAEVAHRNVSVHILCPGYVKTDLSNRALTTNASAEYAKTDETTASGYEPLYVAERALKGIKNKKEYIVIAQTKAVFALWLKKHFPGVLRKIMNARGKAADVQA